jgi:flagellar basal body P-ring protein FlgI
VAAIGEDTAGKVAEHGYTERNAACTIHVVERLNITLDDEQAEKLARLADRLHVQPGTVARSLLSSAIDEADPDPRNVVELLDGIPGAHERAELGLRQARAGETVPLDEL